MVTTEVSMKALPTLEGALFREHLIVHGAHLGNRHPFVDLSVGLPWLLSSPSAEHLESLDPSLWQNC